MIDTGDVIVIRPPVRDRAIGSGSKIIDDAGMGEYFIDRRWAEARRGQIHHSKFRSIDKYIIIGGEAKRKACFHGLIVETEVGGTKGTAWRQGGPSDEILRSTPCHPRRGPCSSGEPKPATLGIMQPTPIMKWNPTPRIIGIPIPAAIGAEPLTAIKVRCPAWITGGNSGLPGPAVARQIGPCAVRSQSVIKIIIGLGSTGIVTVPVGSGLIRHLIWLHGL